MGDGGLPVDIVREFVRTLEPGDRIVVDARDRTRRLEVSQPARYVHERYRTTGYYLPLEGYGTHYTLSVPDNDTNAIRLRWPSNPGLGERVHGLEPPESDAAGDLDDFTASPTTASTGRDVDPELEVEGESDREPEPDQPPIVSDTTVADILDPGPEGDFR